MVLYPNKLPESERVCSGICMLYNALDSIVSHHVNLELVGDRLQFCIYHFHEWPDYTLFLIPIDFTEKLKGEIKVSIRRNAPFTL